MVNITEIKDMDIVLVTSKNWLGEAIRDFIESNVNHLGICVWFEGRLYVSEAERYGLQLIPFEEYILTEKYSTVFVGRFRDILIDDLNKQIPKFKNLVLIMTGSHRYDFFSLMIAQPIKHIVRKLTGRKIWIGKKNNVAKKKFTCSEWVAYVYDLLFGRFPKWWMTDPSEIKNNPKLKIFKEIVLGNE